MKLCSFQTDLPKCNAVDQFERIPPGAGHVVPDRHLVGGPIHPPVHGRQLAARRLRRRVLGRAAIEPLPHYNTSQAQ